MERFLYLQDIHLEKSPFKVFGKVRVRVERDWTNSSACCLPGSGPVQLTAAPLCSLLLTTPTKGDV